MANEVLGFARLYIDLKVSADEMKDWEPRRISAFFLGVAMAQRAASNAPFDLDEESRLIAIGIKPEYAREMIADY